MNKKIIKCLLCIQSLIIFGCESKEKEPPLNPIVERTVFEVSESMEVNAEGLYEIRVPLNLHLGNAPEKVLEEYSSATIENTPEGMTPLSVQMTNYFIDEDGYLVEVYTKEQLSERIHLMYDSVFLIPYYDEDESALREVVFDSDDFTSVRVYVDSNDYFGGRRDSEQWFSRQLVKIYITSFMGLHQIYSGVAIDKWSANISVYDVDSREFIEEYNFPTEEYPFIEI